MEVWKISTTYRRYIELNYFIEHSTDACLLSIKWQPGWNWVLFTLHNYLNISFDFTHAHIHSPTPTFKYSLFSTVHVLASNCMHAQNMTIYLIAFTWNFAIILIDHTINIPFILRKLVTILQNRDSQTIPFWG